eukprot:1016915-Prorocentrum_minimum.AAC.1
MEKKTLEALRELKTYKEIPGKFCARGVNSCARGVNSCAQARGAFMRSRAMHLKSRMKYVAPHADHRRPLTMRFRDV